MSEIKDTRSSVAYESLSELIEEEGVAMATVAYANQYQTPLELSNKLNKRLFELTSPAWPIAPAFDPQFAEGNTVDMIRKRPRKVFGFEIDNRIDYSGDYWTNVITTGCSKAFEIFDECFADGDGAVHFDVANANPPFGKRWTINGVKIDSTEATWKFVTAHANRGWFIGNRDTLKRLGYNVHPWCVHYEEHENVWKSTEVVIGVVFWSRPGADIKECSYDSVVNSAWSKLRHMLEEERKGIPKHNVWLDSNGKLKAYLSSRFEAKLHRKLKREDILNLARLNDCHPLALTTDRETRRLLRELLDCGFYSIDEQAEAAIKDALDQVARTSVPILPATDFESVAYADEEDYLSCIKTVKIGKALFEEGKRYAISTATYNFIEKFNRTKVHFDEKSLTMFSALHECTRSGQDRYIVAYDANNNQARFMDKPRPSVEYEIAESHLWEYFKRPEINTIMEVAGDKVRRNLERMSDFEFFSEFKYFPGQAEYIARLGVKSYGLVAAAVGTGKTLCALTLYQLHHPQRGLIIAPQGTLRSSESEDDDDDGVEYNASQWVQEIRRFAPGIPVFELFEMDDYYKLKKANGGELPFGLYITYYQAFFQNKSRESVPSTWKDEKLCSEAASMLKGFKSANENAMKIAVCSDDSEPRKWCETVGHEKDGIRCIMQPTMSTLIGHEFDGVFIDEFHVASKLSSNLSQQLVRLQPKIRYGLTATPIPNSISDLFPLMGWLCVKDWYKGGIRNAAWPFAREDLGRFVSTFQSVERDHTEENQKRAADPFWRGKCERISPVISSPARLLKLLKPTMAYISKERCNPNYRPAKVVDVRVPMGTGQAKLYGHFLNRGNIQAKNPLVRARKQSAYLRNICADPSGFTHGGPVPSSNMNPKTFATMNLIKEIIAKDEQVVVIASRVGQTRTIASMLSEAGVPFARIDSTMAPTQHARNANIFKNGRRWTEDSNGTRTRNTNWCPVLLMGIKCAASYSFHLCENMIVGSLEWSFGTKEQAFGRVDRINSPKPPTVYCILCKDSIEELMYDVAGVKGDAATICLRGQRVPRDFKPVDASELLAKAIEVFNFTKTTGEEIIAKQWPKLRDELAELTIK